MSSLDVDLHSLDDHIEKLRQKQKSRGSKEPMSHSDPADQVDNQELREAKESFFD